MCEVRGPEALGVGYDTLSELPDHCQLWFHPPYVKWRSGVNGSVLVPELIKGAFVG